ncbi:hypothetical protein RhiJN_11103 [Ceratobasidium sp. AG-Ba]|nr:hypothetical protein RhiJN_11103 [Ceratobasidium sp. AG-Ba]QRW11811.1 hypothetical protein RhiLY_10810 [Ceratobasidium sp. AG-Ba]
MFINNATKAAPLLGVSEQTEVNFSDPHGSDEHETEVPDPPDPPDLHDIDGTNMAGSNDALAEELQAIRGDPTMLNLF